MAGHGVQDVSHHRADRTGRLHRRVARGQGPAPRLAQRGHHSALELDAWRCAFPCPAGTLRAEDTGGGWTPLVLIHADWTDSGIWDSLIPLLRDRYRVIRYDLRGRFRGSVGDRGRGVGLVQRVWRQERPSADGV